MSADVLTSMYPCQTYYLTLAMTSIGQTLKFNQGTTQNERNHTCMSLANELYSYKLSVLATDSLSCHHRYAVVQTYDIFWANDTTATIQEGNSCVVL